MKLIIIRHSQSLINSKVPIDSWGLSEEGVRLAIKLQEHKEVKKIEVIYSSLQPKAVETAILATKNKGIYLRTDDRLTEITSFTKQFQSLDLLEENTKLFYSGKIQRLFNGESKEEALHRFNTAIEDIVSIEKDKENIGIVSHGAILAFFIGQFTREEPYDLLQKMRKPDVIVTDWDKKIINAF